MANANQAPFQAQLSQHAFNKDRSLVALSANSSEVHIFKTNGKPASTKDWTKEPAFVLKEHTGYVSGIDWHPETDQIVTASHDRNAYVWKFDAGEWKPTLVILRINRAATAVAWSPCGKKFAVASGAKCVPICHFEESNNWWISKMIKKHKSTVTSVAWSPNSKFLLTGSCDFKARVFSAYIEGVDTDDDDELSALYPKAKEFGESLAEYAVSASWVNATAWSPNGKVLAWVGQGATLHTCAPGEKSPAVVFSKSLPFLHVLFLDDDTIVCVGWDNNPHIFKNKGGSWELEKKLDEEKTAAAGPAKKKAFGSAFAKFQQADTEGQKFGAKKADNSIKTFHKNTITSVFNFGDGKTFTCASLDGRLLTWAV